MKHILIIDDDIYIGDVLEKALTKEGYRVSRAYSGTEAPVQSGAVSGRETLNSKMPSRILRTICGRL